MQVLPLNQLFRCQRCQIDSHADCMGEPCQCTGPAHPARRGPDQRPAQQERDPVHRAALSGPALPLNQLFRCQRCQIDGHADCMGEPCQCICPQPLRPRTRFVRLPLGNLLDLDKFDVRFFPAGWIEAMTTPVLPEEIAPDPPGRL